MACFAICRPPAADQEAPSGPTVSTPPQQQKGGRFGRRINKKKRNGRNSPRSVLDPFSAGTSSEEKGTSSGTSSNSSPASAGSVMTPTGAHHALGTPGADVHATRGALLHFLALNSDAGSSPADSAGSVAVSRTGGPVSPVGMTPTALELSPTQVVPGTNGDSSYHTALASCGHSSTPSNTSAEDVERFSTAVAGAVGGAVQVS